MKIGKRNKERLKVAVLFSGGKDSTLSLLYSMKFCEVKGLISVISKNKDSFFFHTPNIILTKKQAKLMNLPIIIKKSKGVKEREILDLERAIKKAIKKWKIEGIVSGAVESVYQASRIQKICYKFNLWCFNPLWQKNQIELLKEIIRNKIKAIVVKVSAYPFNKSWMCREIDNNFIKDVSILNEKYGINPSGEGGEYESFVLYAPFFKRNLRVISKKIYGEKNYWICKLDVK